MNNVINHIKFIDIHFYIYLGMKALSWAFPFLLWFHLQPSKLVQLTVDFVMGINVFCSLRLSFKLNEECSQETDVTNFKTMFPSFKKMHFTSLVTDSNNNLTWQMLEGFRAPLNYQTFLSSDK